MQKVQFVHLAFGQERFSRDTVAIALKLCVGVFTTHAGGPEPQMHQLMKHREGPSHWGVLIVDDNKWRNGICNRVTPENATGDVRVMAAKIPEQQHEGARILNPLA